MSAYLKEIKMYWHYLFIVLICMVIDRNTMFQGTQEFHMKIPASVIYITCSVLSYFIFAIQMYRKETISRLILGLSLFSSLVSIAWLTNMSSILYYYDKYGHVFPFVFIMGVGLFTALFTQANFIGVVSDNKKAVAIASLKLFVVTILVALFSFSLQVITPSLFFLALYDWKLRDGLSGKRNPWKFNW